MESIILDLAFSFEKRVANRLMLMLYRFSELCVKAEPAALLSAEIMKGGSKVNIEDAADVVVKEWNQYLIAAHEGYDIMSVGTAIAEKHPEFKQEFVTMKVKAGSDDTMQVLLVTVPEVDDIRHEILVNGVKAYSDAFKASVDFEMVAATTKMTPHLLEASKEDQDAAKALLTEKADQYKKQAAEAADNKNNEIEEAYAKYLESQQDKKSKLEELKQAANPDAATKMKLN